MIYPIAGTLEVTVRALKPESQYSVSYKEKNVKKRWYHGGCILCIWEDISKIVKDVWKWAWNTLYSSGNFRYTRKDLVEEKIQANKGLPQTPSPPPAPQNLKYIKLKQHLATTVCIEKKRWTVDSYWHVINFKTIFKYKTRHTFSEIIFSSQQEINLGMKYLFSYKKHSYEKAFFGMVCNVGDLSFYNELDSCRKQESTKTPQVILISGE